MEITHVGALTAYLLDHWFAQDGAQSVGVVCSPGVAPRDQHVIPLIRHYRATENRPPKGSRVLSVCPVSQVIRTPPTGTGSVF